MCACPSSAAQGWCSRPVSEEAALRAFPIMVAGAVAFACGPTDRDIRIERLQAERRSLEATFDHLEDRLLVNQARVRFWLEMRERHESVSAVACASLEQHAEEMASHGIGIQHSSLHRSRVASAPSAAERVPAVAAGRP
jgi:hypothetical protein